MALGAVVRVAWLAGGEMVSGGLGNLVACLLRSGRTVGTLARTIFGSRQLVCEGVKAVKVPDPTWIYSRSECGLNLHLSCSQRHFPFHRSPVHHLMGCCTHALSMYTALYISLGS